nr:immunoglobulin heavy chain junction region [Mus musculus]
CTADVNDYW